MAENPHVNEVIYGDQVILSTKNTTVTPNTLLEGATALDATGALITGTAIQGHTIVDSGGTALTQRANLKFQNATITDDAVNDTTIVTPQGQQITIDPTPTQGSTNAVQSGGVYTALQGKANNSVVSKTANGLAPQLPNETTTTKYLRQDGTWQVPPDTTYSAMSASELTTGTATTRRVVRADYLKSGIVSLINSNSYKRYSWSWTYLVDITTTTGSGMTAYVFINGCVIRLQTSGSNFDTPGVVAVSNKSNLDHLTYSKSGLNIKINSTDHTPGFILCSDNSLTVTTTDTSTPQSTAMTAFFDTTPTSGSVRPVTSGGVYTALQNKVNADATDYLIDASSVNGGSGGGLIKKTAGRVVSYIYELARNYSAAISSSLTTASYRYIRKSYNTASGTATADMRISPYRMKYNTTLSTSSSITVTFSNSLITTESVVSVYTTIYGVSPSSISVANGSCAIVFPKYTSAASMSVVLEFDTLYN